ncbi:class I SAM-dependent methyltransferase [Pirellulaceae bacterium SH501]
MTTDQPRKNHCKICGGATVSSYSAGVYTYFRCVRCNTSACDPVPSTQELESFYSRFHLAESEGGVYDRVESRMVADFPNKVTIVKRFGGSTVLDYGCGKGFFVKYCREAGLDATGFDLSDSAVRYAKSVLKVPALCGTSGEDQFGGRKFSAVTMWATIEHVPNPRETIEFCASLLESNGMLHLDTGNGHDWLDRFLPGVNQWYDPPQHLYVFSVAGLLHLIKNSGLDPVRIDRAYDRSRTRRSVRFLRDSMFTFVVRCLSEGLYLSKSMSRITRFPVGNLQSISARKT